MCVVVSADQFQVTDGKTVHPQVIILIDALQRGDMLQVGMFGIFQVMQDGARCDDAGCQAFHTKSFQAMRAEMFEQCFCSYASVNIHSSML